MIVMCKGDVIGVIGLKLLYILFLEVCKKLVEIKDMFIDIGVFS